MILYQSSRTRIRRDMVSGQSVIVKEFLGGDAGRRLRHECSILHRLARCEAVPCLLSPSGGGPALVMVDDGLPSLAQWRYQEDSGLLKVARLLAAVLVQLHSRGVLHKDLNPSNLLFCPERNVAKAIDFDLATTFAQERPGFMHPSQIAGTLPYLAPEQTGRMGRGVDHRADLYALGVTLYELVSGQLPFRSEDPLDLLHEILTRVPSPPQSSRLGDIIMRLLEKEPDRRYQSAEGLLHDLSELQGGGTLNRLGRQDFPLRLSAPTRLVGRDGELEKLRKAFQCSRRGLLTLVLVAGSPGVGKTALVDSLRPLITAERGWFTVGKFDQYRQDAAFALTQALDGLARMLLAEPEEQLSVVRARLLAGLGGNAGLLAAALPGFAILLGVPPQHQPSDSLEAELRFRGAVVELLRCLSSLQPVVLFVDDLQWAGPAALRLLDALAADGSLPGLLVVGAYRVGELDSAHPLAASKAAWERLPQPPAQISLENLPPQDLGELLEEMLHLPAGAAAELALALAPQTGGNPYDTVELVNALRHDGTLRPSGEGWSWDAQAVRKFVGQSSVLQLLEERIARLPAATQELLSLAACLGNEVDLALLEVASDCSSAGLETGLAPALDDGLLLMERGGRRVGFRHDRVQQAAYDRLTEGARIGHHLTLGRRLQAADLRLPAAEQFYPVHQHLSDPEERTRVARLFGEAGACARRGADAAGAERFLGAAIGLLGDDCSGLAAQYEIERHLALYSLARLDEVDLLYASIQARGHPPGRLVSPTCVQIAALCTRTHMREALELGLELAGRLGLVVPEGDLSPLLERRFDLIDTWLESPDAGRCAPPEVRRLAHLLGRLLVPAVMVDLRLNVYLTLESVCLWLEHGPCREHIVSIGALARLLVCWRQDFRKAYALAQRNLSLGEQHGYEPETSLARVFFCHDAQHWYEPLENVLKQARQAHQNLVQHGELDFATLAYSPIVFCSLETAPSLDSVALEVKAASAFARRAGGHAAGETFVSYQRIIEVLRGEASELQGLLEEPPPTSNNFSQAFHWLNLAILLTILGESAPLEEVLRRLQPVLPLLESFPNCIHGQLLRGMWLLDQLRRCRGDQDAHQRELACLCVWMEVRAADSPANYRHLALWLQAEQAWFHGERWQALAAFDAALRHLDSVQRPWHRGLIAERAGCFSLQEGLESAGRRLLLEARRGFQVWGAMAKVARLDAAYPFLQLETPASNLSERRSTIVLSDSIDLLAVLRASQALSSQTSLRALQTRVAELLGALTGASSVVLACRSEGGTDWRVLGGLGEVWEMSLQDARLPLSAFRYVCRTEEELISEDAVQDPRFAQDPYWAGVERCSLMVVPILSQGQLRAILVLENRLSRGAFSPARLDAVRLIAGQLAVSLENALLYASLEGKVEVRTLELAGSLSSLRATLESTADGIVVTGEDLAVTDFNENFLKMWGVSRQAAERDGGEIMLELGRGQLKQPQEFWRHMQSNEDSFDVLEFRDGRVYERYSKPRWVEQQKLGRVWSFRDVTERKQAEAELGKAHRQLVDTSRRAGMAEVATNVLHNVGNVLNSVNVSAHLLQEASRRSKLPGLAKLVQLCQEHEANPGEFFASQRGRQVVEYLQRLSQHLHEEQAQSAAELHSLLKNVDHVKEIVARQQSYARVSGIREPINPVDLVEDCLTMQTNSLERHELALKREYSEVPSLCLDKHKVLQVLVNLLTNAKQACLDSGLSEREIKVSVRANSNLVCIAVADNGVGIPPDHLTRIFQHGFTTRKEGHGFGLHSGALAAKEMGGELRCHSDGLGTGATFSLELPIGDQK